MRRVVRDPVKQTLMFEKIMCLVFLHVLGVRPEGLQNQCKASFAYTRDPATPHVASPSSTAPGGGARREQWKRIRGSSPKRCRVLNKISEATTPPAPGPPKNSSMMPQDCIPTGSQIMNCFKFKTNYLFYYFQVACPRALKSPFKQSLQQHLSWFNIASNVSFNLSSNCVYYCGCM